MTAAQLSLSRPGYCARCTITRLSVADLDGLCMFCREEPPLRQRTPATGRYTNKPLPVVNGQKMCRCGRGPLASGSYLCRQCNTERRRAERQRRPRPAWGGAR